MRGDGHTDADLCVALPGGRRARIVAADDAGQTRLHILDADWIDRLLCLGLIDPGQHDAAVALAALHEACGVRQRLASPYDGVVVDGVGDTGSPLEHMTGSEARAWRRLHRLLRCAPQFARGEVQAVCLDGLRPISIARLRAGLAAIARALRSGR